MWSYRAGDSGKKTGLRTPEYEEALAWTRNITVEQLREGYTKNAIPIGRAGRLAEVADFVCYLLSERASYITGVTTNIAAAKHADKEALWSTPFFVPTAN
ncbi:sorbitol-6-phosphate 2-dehydrogenase [Escherichia coli]|uniref:Sorbitol-6-phosphate 2-dehydrogenase n=1 Tax=Escherichia coli TaxID=562 RepID=A0A376MPI6_ECOLX|nr:sorbitol-6-phosphate 2-dehydrogenase [Escherichia coli]